MSYKVEVKPLSKRYVVYVEEHLVKYMNAEKFEKFINDPTSSYLKYECQNVHEIVIEHKDNDFHISDKLRKLAGNVFSPGVKPDFWALQAHHVYNYHNMEFDDDDVFKTITVYTNEKDNDPDFSSIFQLLLDNGSIKA